MHIVLIVIGYLLIVWQSAAALFAHCQGTWYGNPVDSPTDWDEAHRRVCRRDDAAYSIALSLIPVTWFMVPFLTAFWQHGWNFTFSDRPRQKRRAS